MSAFLFWLYSVYIYRFPAKWEDKNIIILDTYRIEHPNYNTVKKMNDKCSDEGFQRIVKVLEGERRKLKLT